MREGKTPYIELINVSYTYPGHTFSLSGVSLAFYAGAITAVTGKNGSGKTTLGKLMTGILKPDSGAIYIQGGDAGKLKLHEFGAKIGYLFQNPDRQLFARTAAEEIMFPLELKRVPKEEREEKCAELLRRFHIEHIRDAAPVALSRGEKQRLALAAILANGPGFLLLDEPGTALDRVRRAELYGLLQSLKENGIGIAAITHDEDFAKEYADSVVTLKEGRAVRYEAKA